MTKVIIKDGKIQNPPIGECHRAKLPKRKEPDNCRCGGKAEPRSLENKTLYWFRCTECGYVSTGEDDPYFATTKWNEEQL